MFSKERFRRSGVPGLVPPSRAAPQLGFSFLWIRTRAFSIVCFFFVFGGVFLVGWVGVVFFGPLVFFVFLSLLSDCPPSVSVLSLLSG